MDQLRDILAQPLVLPIAIALLAGLLAFVLSRMALVGKVLALAAGIVVILAGIQIVRYFPEGGSFAWSWVDLGQGVQFNVDLSWTVLGMVVLFGAAAFELLIAVYSFRAMAGHWAEGKFYAYMIWSLAGACIVALADNLLVLLVGWELVTLLLFLMINQGGKAAGAGAAKTYGMLGFADACLLLAVAILMATGGAASLSLSLPRRKPAKSRQRRTRPSATSADGGGSRPSGCCFGQFAGL